MLWNKASTPPLCHCIPLLFSDPLSYQNIRITVRGEYNHSNPAGQIPLHDPFWVCAAQFHTNRLPYGNFRVLKNIFRFHSTIPLVANQSSYCAATHLMQPHPDPVDNNSRHRRRTPRFCSRSILLLRAEIVPVQKQPLRIVCDNTAHARNNIAAANPTSFPPHAASDIFSDDDNDACRSFFRD